MARHFLLVLVAVGGALAEKQSPSELATLAIADPQNYRAVSELLERQKVGTLDDRIHKVRALTAEEKQDFESSQAMKDRQNVLSSVRNMMAQRQQWAAEESTSKYSRLSRELTEQKKPAAPVLKKKKLAAIRIDSNERDEEELAILRAKMPQHANANGAARRQVSWSAMKQRTQSLRAGGRSSSAKGVSAAGSSWGDLMKQFQGGRRAMEVEKEQKEVKGPLSSFSWGSEESLARNGPEAAQPEHKKAELSMVAEKKLSMPDEMDMPDELDQFLNGAKKEPAYPSKKKQASRYLAELN